MSVPSFVIDTSALLAFTDDEPGAHRVAQLIATAQAHRATLTISFITLLELYYIRRRRRGAQAARRLVAYVKTLPLGVIHSYEKLLWVAGRLKVEYRLPLADALVAATAHELGATLIHKDPDFLSLRREMTLVSL